MLPVLIAGGGIGGLTLAIALARQGIASRVFEARAEPTREGAGIQLGPNATRILQALGLAEALQPHTVSPDCIIVNDGVSGRELTRLPLGEWMSRRHGAPYWVVHRAALYKVLWSAAAAEPLIEIAMGRSVDLARDGPDAGCITAVCSDGTEAPGRILAGADGLWSRVREQIDPGFKMTYNGVAAARALVPRARLGRRFTETATRVWLAPNAHVVHYPVDGGETVAIVAIGKCDVPPDGWNTAVEPDVIAERFAQMPDTLRGLLAVATSWRQWPLYAKSGSARWTRGRCVLIGDAAHPILPYLAQGGAMAIEDGFELAGMLADGPAEDYSDIVTTLGAFCRKRLPRIVNVQGTSAANGRAYHAEGLTALGRNAALRSLPGAVFMRRYDWIYGYRG